MTTNLGLNGRLKLTAIMLLMACVFSTTIYAERKATSVEAPDIAEVKANAKHYVGSLKALLQKKCQKMDQLVRLMFVVWKGRE